MSFRLVHSGHCLGGGAGRPLRRGYVVVEHDGEIPGQHGPSLVRWGKSINAESLSTAIRLIQNVQSLAPELRHNILSQIY